MRTVRRAAALAMGILLLAVGTAAGQERRYTYVPVGTFGVASEDGSRLLGVNESGVATGTADYSTGSGYAISWNQGGIASLGGVFDSGGSAGTSINDAGDITGVTWVNPYEPGT